MPYSIEVPYHVLLPAMFGQKGLPTHVCDHLLCMLPAEGHSSAMNARAVRAYNKRLTAPGSRERLQDFINTVLRETQIWEIMDMMSHDITYMLVPTNVQGYTLNTYWMFVRAIVWVIISWGIRPMQNQANLAKSNAQLLSLLCRSPPSRDPCVNAQVLIAMHLALSVLIGVLDLCADSCAFRDVVDFAKVLQRTYESKGFPVWSFEGGYISDEIGGDLLLQLPGPLACSSPGVAKWLQWSPAVHSVAQLSRYQGPPMSTMFA